MRTASIVSVGLLSLLLLCSFTLAQSYRGEAIPVAQRATPVEFSRLRFLTFAFGREGPMDTPLSTPPVAGREYFVEADVYGVESAASLRFDLLDAGGRALQTLTMWKASDGIDDGEFYGFVTVPAEPFRVAVTGTGTSGAPIRAALATLFQPAASGPPDRAILPPAIPANQSGRIQGMLESYRQQLKARAAQAATEHPQGVIALERTIVSPIAYEPLTSASGAPIGIRLRYSARFPARKTISVAPHVFPVYRDVAWRGVVAMKPLGGTITPPPEMVGVQSLQDVLVYQAAATYQAGVNYNFTIDMVPDFVFKGSQSGRFCIYEQKFTNNNTTWKALVSSPDAISYSVTIFDTGTAATIPSFFPQRTFYENIKSGGAIDCGPTPNIRF